MGRSRALSRHRQFCSDPACMSFVRSETPADRPRVVINHDAGLDESLEFCATRKDSA